MRVQYLSDLHLESCAFTLKVRDDADVLVLAGDIASAKHTTRFEKLLHETMGKPTILIHGNHEFYNGRMEAVKEQRLTICKRHPNVHLLDDTWEVINGVQFIGSTLWSDFKLPFTYQGRYESDPEMAMELAASDIMGIRDFSIIAYEGHIFRPRDAAALHVKARHALDLISKVRYPTVIVSHFQPSPLSIDPRFKASPLNPYFASHCEDLMGDNVKAWIHGHTHSSCSYLINGTRVACNPRGYKNSENPGFNSQAYIDVDA